MTASDCIFCKIVAGQIPSAPIYQDEQAYAFADLHPQAPVHTLVIPRRHIESLHHIAAEDRGLVGHLQWVATEVARLQHLGQGYRVVINIGADGGQTVSHLHLHVLGGRAMHWPPG
jgi:histidine triad (HIT) family protein